MKCVGVCFLRSICALYSVLFVIWSGSAALRDVGNSGIGHANRRLKTSHAQAQEERFDGLKFLKNVRKGIRRKVEFAKQEALSELNRDPRQDQGVLSFQTATNYAYQHGDDIINAVKTDGFQKQLGTQSQGDIVQEYFQEGFEQGLSHGLVQGSQSGISAGFESGFQTGFQKGYEQGLHTGVFTPPINPPKITQTSDQLFLKGFSDGYQEGIKEGFDAGLQDRTRMDSRLKAEPIMFVEAPGDIFRLVDDKDKDIQVPQTENPESITTVFSEKTLSKIKQLLQTRDITTQQKKNGLVYDDEALERDLEQALTLLYSENDSGLLEEADNAAAERILDALGSIVDEDGSTKLGVNQDFTERLQEWQQSKADSRQNAKSGQASADVAVKDKRKNEFTVEQVSFSEDAFFSTSDASELKIIEQDPTLDRSKSTKKTSRSRTQTKESIPVVVCLLAVGLAALILRCRKDQS